MGNQFTRCKSRRMWRASVRTRRFGGRLLGVISAPTRDAAETIAVQLFKLSNEERSRLWLLDLF